jgi:flagellar motor protein MotB
MRLLPVLSRARIAGVTGKGEAFPMYPEDPFASGNRRIEITLEAAAPAVAGEAAALG